MTTLTLTYLSRRNNVANYIELPRMNIKMLRELRNQRQKSFVQEI